MYHDPQLGFLKKLKKLRKTTLHGRIRGAVGGLVRGRRRRGGSAVPPIAVPPVAAAPAPIPYEAPPLAPMPAYPYASPEPTPAPYEAPPMPLTHPWGSPSIAPALPAPSTSAEWDVPYWHDPAPRPEYAPIHELPGYASARDREYDELETEGDFSSEWGHSLAGVLEAVSPEYWRRRWDDAVAKLQGRIAEFFGLRARLVESRKLAERAQEAAAKRPAVPDSMRLRLRELAGAVASQLTDQGALEKRVKSALAKIEGVKLEAARTQQIGILPLAWPAAVGAAAVAGLVGLVGLVVIHTQRVKATAAELDLVARKVLTADEVARVKGAGVFGGLGSLLSGLPLVALVGGGLYLWSRRRRSA